MPPEPAIGALQEAWVATLRHGPDHCPPGLFVGAQHRVWRGLKVHANTISHARLVALEETFPRLQGLLGEAEFNRLARAFVEAGGGCARPLALIGADFPAWLAPRAEPLAARLALMEWLWLEAFNAADAEPLALAGLDPEALLALHPRLHPALRLCPLDALLATQLGLAANGPWLALVRPAAEVHALALDDDGHALLTLCDGRRDFATVIETFCAAHPNRDVHAALAALLAAGALIGGEGE